MTVGIALERGEILVSGGLLGPWLFVSCVYHSERRMLSSSKPFSGAGIGGNEEVEVQYMKKIHAGEDTSYHIIFIHVHGNNNSRGFDVDKICLF